MRSLQHPLSWEVRLACLRWRALWCLPLVFVLSLVSSARADADACLEAHERSQVDRMQGHYVAARAALLTCAQRDCPRLVSNECSNWLGQLDAALPTVVFSVSGEDGRDLVDVRILLDGKAITEHIDGRALALDPGVYKLRFVSQGYAAAEESLSVRDGEKNRLVRVTLRRPPDAATEPLLLTHADPDRAANAAFDERDSRLRVATYALGSAALVGGAVALGTGLRGFLMLQHCKHDGCSDAYVGHGKSLYRAADVSGAAGGLLLVSAGLTLWGALHREGNLEKQASHGFGAWADASGASLSAWRRW